MNANPSKNARYVNPLSDEETDKLKQIMDKVEADARRDFKHKSGEFATCSISHITDDNIYLSLRYGVQNDVEDCGYEDNLKVERDKMQLSDEGFFPSKEYQKPELADFDENVADLMQFQENKRLEGEGYFTYLMLHILEENHLFDTEACDERWEIAKHHYAHWRNSSWDNMNESHYCCFDKYARWFVSHWKTKLPLSKIPTNDNS